MVWGFFLPWNSLKCEYLGSGVSSVSPGAEALRGRLGETGWVVTEEPRDVARCSVPGVTRAV